MLYQDDKAARLFAERHLKVSFADPMIGLVVTDHGFVVGAAILNGYIPGDNIDISAVGNISSIKVIRGIARYCFKRVRRVTAKTCVTNKPAIKALKALRFKQEGVLREYFSEGDAIVFGLLRREQRIVRL